MQHVVRRNLRDGVGATSDGLVACPAVPDADGVTLDGGLAAEGAGVAGVLGDFHLQSCQLQAQGAKRAVVRLPSSPAYAGKHRSGCRTGVNSAFAVPAFRSGRTDLAGDADLCDRISD